MFYFQTSRFLRPYMRTRYAARHLRLGRVYAPYRSRSGTTEMAATQKAARQLQHSAML